MFYNIGPRSLLAKSGAITTDQLPLNNPTLQLSKTSVNAIKKFHLPVTRHKNKLQCLHLALQAVSIFVSE
jgi:hypothetical protein